MWCGGGAVVESAVVVISRSIDQSINQASLVCEEGSVKGSIELRRKDELRTRDVFVCVDQSKRVRAMCESEEEESESRSQCHERFIYVTTEAIPLTLP
jgi:hypothetical protein